MEKELNIAAILKDKPKGTMLYSAMIGECFLKELLSSQYPIFVDTKNRGTWHFLKDGKFEEEGECMLFPSKSMRSWSKFAWKKGDVLKVATGGDCSCIFDRFTNDDYTEFTGVFDKYLDRFDCFSTSNWSKVTDEKECESIIQRIETQYGGKLNLDTLKIEKPQFKDGDIVVLDDDGMSHFKTILLYQSNINNEYEVYSFLNAGTQFLSLEATLMDDRKARPATDSEKQQLFDALAKVNKAWDAEKKAIVDLPKKCGFKPMDWCLMRDFGEKWKLCQFGFKDETEDADHAPYNAIGGNWFNECIPYNDKTSHLLGTTDDYEEGGEV